MPQIRAYGIVCGFTLFCLVIGCNTKRDAELKPRTLVGDYVLQMGDSGAPHRDPDKLTLKADGTYVLVHMPGGHQGSTEEGTWKPWNNLGQAQVAFGNATYPVHIRGKRVTLIVNDDLDYFYEKTR